MLSLSFTAVEFSSHFYVLFLFEDFDLAMKWPLEKDVCICLNHLNFKLPLASLSAGSSRLNYMYRAQKTQIFLCSMLVSCRLIYLSQDPCGLHQLKIQLKIVMSITHITFSSSITEQKWQLKAGLKG